jgi:inosine-uridine nucleoside N-ribohydrolase
VDLILDETRRRPGEITLVTLGPLTNLAVALLREPALPGLLKGYALMGGAYGVAGNTTPTNEWNIHCHPEAAKIVFRAWADASAADPPIPLPLALGLDASSRRGSSRRRRPARPTRRQHARRLIALARGEDPMRRPGPWRAT